MYLDPDSLHFPKVFKDQKPQLRTTNPDDVGQRRHGRTCEDGTPGSILRCLQKPPAGVFLHPETVLKKTEKSIQIPRTSLCPRSRSEMDSLVQFRTEFCDAPDGSTKIQRSHLNTQPGLHQAFVCFFVGFNPKVVRSEEVAMCNSQQKEKRKRPREEEMSTYREGWLCHLWRLLGLKLISLHDGLDGLVGPLS